LVTIQENISLAPLTTLQVGGEARYFVLARREDEVREAVEFANTRQLPLFVLGGGSNLVVADSGWPGLVMRMAMGGISSEGARDAVLFSVGAGHDWDDFVAQAITQNCAGVECLSGIPGSVGGTPVQNVGAYGQQVSDTIESVRALDRKLDRVVVLPKPACGFRYRSSIFNGSERDRYVILQVNYRLKRGGAPSLKYADLQKHFDETEGPPSLAEVREAVRQIRRGKGMLIVPGDEDSRSAGSFFKNPVLSEQQFQDVAALAQSKGVAISSYPGLESQHKISAAWLVENSGFAKGFRLGRAGISGKHALALINAGDARASDIIQLKDAIQRGVRSEWGILLEPEPVFLGFTGEI
jgi:UDP-N-acetylmuramate dehydrogenase